MVLGNKLISKKKNSPNLNEKKFIRIVDKLNIKHINIKIEKKNVILNIIFLKEFVII